jgi:hypothetical protein
MTGLLDHRCGRALEKLAEALEEERAALRAMDPEAVVAAAERKEQCVAELAASGIKRHPEYAQRFAELVREQHKNLRMLIYARELVHDALLAAGAVAPGYGRGKPALPPGAAIDVRG